MMNDIGMAPLEEGMKKDAQDQPTEDVQTEPQRHEPRPDDLVRDPHSVGRVFRRLHDAEGSIMFKTISGDMNVLIRSDADSEDTSMVYDLGFTVPDEIVSMEFDGSVDESGVYVYQVITFDKDMSDDDLVFVTDIINRAYRTKICECSERIIWDDHPICAMCDLCRIKPETTSMECVICSDDIETSRGCVTMACCQQTMHKSCRARYERETKNACPVCRSTK